MYIYIINALLWSIAILISVALLTLIERVLLGAYQRRLGPDTVGVYGLLQPIADAIKLVTKGTSASAHSATGIFYLAPLYALTLMLTAWSLVVGQFMPTMSSLTLTSVYSNTSVIAISDVLYGYDWLLLLAILGMTIYSVLLLGWAANSTYAFIGSLRASAAMISYELILTTSALAPIIASGSYAFNNIIYSQHSSSYMVAMLPIMMLFVISVLAEASRVPFDLVEAESELVAGYMTEHASVAFTLLFLAEYMSILLFAAINSVLWLGSNTYVYIALATSAMVTIVILARALLPRLRYDQLIALCWLHLLPIAFVLLVLVVCLVVVLL